MINMKKVIELEPSNKQAVLKYAEIKEKMEQQMNINKNHKKPKKNKNKKKISFSDNNMSQE